MKKFNYQMKFSPYGCSLRAKNYKDAWAKLQETWPEYNVKEVCQYLCYA